jgi:uncharacterized glyoxalase superfamily metalloenzyme YdcJ
MPDTEHVSPHLIRSAFSSAMSEMYKKEVPAYGTLMDLVGSVNQRKLEEDAELRSRLADTGNLDRISAERHGAIRLGTANELAMMRRIFAVMGMRPVGYYDLSEAGVPVHATAFRPVDNEALKTNPFRVFTSLLRLDLISDASLRQEATVILEQRNIFSERLIELTNSAERDGGLSAGDAKHFVSEVLEIFRWHDKAIVNADLYKRLHDAHRLLADVVSFRGPHINHLTPRTLDIDEVQSKMPACGISPKAFVEGPPTRNCPILLRQTSFKALVERVAFRDEVGGWQPGFHTARFGEIEQRGIALTPKGRALYDELLASTRKFIKPAGDGSNAKEYVNALSDSFKEFPDTWEMIRAEGLGYFSYSLTNKERQEREVIDFDTEALIKSGVLRYDPIVYEDFLPVSAAGIFQSNLGDNAQQEFSASPSQLKFEAALGEHVLNEFEYYAKMQVESLERCKKVLLQEADGRNQHRKGHHFRDYPLHLDGHGDEIVAMADDIAECSSDNERSRRQR